MHYWKIPKYGKPAIDLGDAPALTRDRFRRGVFSALVPSSGQYKAMRYFYEVMNDHLVGTSAVGFEPAGDGKYFATSMNRSVAGEFIEISKKKVTLSVANQCVRGEMACW